MCYLATIIWIVRANTLSKKNLFTLKINPPIKINRKILLYNTRLLSYQRQSTSSRIQELIFFPWTTKIWNDLPHSILDIISRKLSTLFKTELNNHTLKITPTTSGSLEYIHPDPDPEQYNYYDQYWKMTYLWFHLSHLWYLYCSCSQFHMSCWLPLIRHQAL